MKVTVEIIETAEEFERLGGEWNELLGSSASSGFFLSHEWLLTWWRHLGGRRKLRIAAVREGDLLLAIAPLAVSPPSARILLPLSRLEFLGAGTVGSDYLDVIARRGREAEALEELSGRLADERAMVQLTHVREGASAAADLAEALRRRGWRLQEGVASRCPFVDLTGLSWEAYLAGRGREHRYSFRRKLRALTAGYETRFEEVRTEDRRRAILPLLWELHERRWARKGRSEAFRTPALRAFHDDVSRLALERGWLRLFMLWLDGRPAAAIYGFARDGIFSFYQSGFDPGLGSLGVGVVAMGLSIKSAIEEGAREYDLLHGLETYKLHWATRTRELRRWEIYPPRALGLVYRTFVTVSRATRRGARRIVSSPAALRRAARGHPAAAGD